MAKPTKPADLPESVTLASHFAFMDEAGKIWSWAEDYAETEADKIKMLIERKAPIK